MAKIYKWIPTTETLDLNKKIVRSGDSVKDSEIDKDTLVKLVAKGKLVPANGEIVVKAELSKETKEELEQLTLKIAEAVELNESLKNDLLAITEERDSLKDSLDQANAKIEELDKMIVSPVVNSDNGDANDKPTVTEPTPNGSAKAKKVEY